ncbi:MAG: polysulfide reductase NrfD [Gammaproteobacteria bacterium]|nr:polysulfide reductase NrfD [Gammaproteobacteria bacterium]MDH5801587.1 polysulfide reductase NrfD [Gammaproteobacteria bacterium]
MMKTAHTEFYDQGDRPIAGRVMVVSAGVLLLLLGVTFYILYSQGHAAFNTSSSGVAWGLPIITYVFLVLTSTGLTFLASLATVFGVEAFYPVAKRCVWLAIATLIAGFTALAMELGHPFRMLWTIPTGLQFRSPMFWMGVFYSIYLIFLLAKFWCINKGDWSSALSRTLGIASFVSVVIAHSTLGLVFGMMAMRPMWYGSIMPIYFLVSAALSGVAFAVFFTYLAYGFRQDTMPDRARALTSSSTLPKVFAATIGITILILVSRVITGLWTNLDGMQVYQELVRSPWFHFELWVGLVLPFVLMISPALRIQAKWQIVSAVLVILALFIGRYEYVISGQLVPLFKGSWISGLINYVPSVTEWLITGVGFALVFAIYSLGDKLFRLDDLPNR